MEEFAFETVEATDEEIKVVAERFKREVISAGVVNLTAAERLFVLSETIPGVARVGGGGHAPEIIDFGAAFFGVENHLDKHNGTTGELLVAAVGGGVGVVAGAVVIINESGGDRELGLVWLILDSWSTFAGSRSLIG